MIAKTSPVFSSTHCKNASVRLFRGLPLMCFRILLKTGTSSGSRLLRTSSSDSWPRSRAVVRLVVVFRSVEGLSPSRIAFSYRFSSASVPRRLVTSSLPRSLARVPRSWQLCRSSWRLSAQSVRTERIASSRVTRASLISSFSSEIRAFTFARRSCSISRRSFLLSSRGIPGGYPKC